MSSTYKGLNKYVNIAFNVSGLGNHILLSTLFSGPYCNDSYCRTHMDKEFFDANLITYVSRTEKFPSESSTMLKNFAKGVQVIPLSQLS